MVNVLDDKKKKLQELIKPVNNTQPVAGVNAPVPQRDIMAEIQSALKANQDVSGLVKERGQKINNDPNLAQYMDSQKELESKYLQPKVTQTVTPTETKISNTSVLNQPQNQISDMYKSQTDAMVAQIRQNIANAKQQQQALIKQAPQTYDPLRAESELSKEQQLRSVLERNANLGDRGGVGRSAALQTQTSGENRLNSINLQQQNFIDSANQEISRLENDGRYQEAQVVANQRAQELQALLEQQRYDQEISRADQIRQEGLTADAEAQSRNDFQNQILANYMDLQAFADRLQAQGAPQWQIDQVQAARTQKIIENNLNPETGLANPVDNTPTLTSSSALSLWEQIGTANESVSRALGIPVGTRYTPEVRGSTSGSSGGSSSVSSTDPNARNLSVSSIKTSIKNFINSTTDNASAESDKVLNTLTTQLKGLDEINDSEYNFDTTKQWEDSKARAEVIRKRVNEMKNRSTSESEKQSAMLWMIQNQDLLQDDDVYDTIASEYNIGDEELADYAKRIQNVSPSVGR